VQQKRDGLFVFTADGEVFALPSVEDRGDLEYPDVEAGEYPAIYTVDGFVVEPTTAKRQVILTVTDVQDEVELRRRLAAVDPEFVEAEDLRAYANRLLAARWEQRWPKRPSWLAERLHGSKPPSV
jgi:hypothetical protein